MGGLVLIKGAGDLATGVAHRLYRCGMQVVMTEIEKPTAVRRTVSFAEAVYNDSHTVEGITAVLVNDIATAKDKILAGVIPILKDPTGKVALQLKPEVVVDAIVAKKNTGTKITDAPLVIGLGPGFTAGVDVDVVVETKRGHHLGRVLLKGSAQPNTGIPGPVQGYTLERVLRAPGDGIFKSCVSIAGKVKAGDLIGYVANYPVTAGIDGILRGLIKDGIWVPKGLKIGDIDPRCKLDYCYTISDKARSIAGGVLEAILYMTKGRP
ncbi:selenium-dependent molybdenum cofactor biosynthesis protein YqeB [Desulfofalx alkaliphila]|uniref:selenium-dependent molybdenum cofactor biosynthesis protein YqeB n=1 Tax=Desulfofalx alkaliphila TaxID=105483 RepID=UPI0004E26BBB|nr:selenium-dependent molybdenum cofactor biosynthesis protein YqeB [Desulfofalx alkaliphila]